MAPSLWIHHYKIASRYAHTGEMPDWLNSASDRYIFPAGPFDRTSQNINLMTSQFTAHATADLYPIHL